MFASGLRRYGCPLLFIVGVDDQNRSCVLGQGVLRSECKETFKWFLDSYETAAGGRRPKVRGAAQRLQTRWGKRPLGDMLCRIVYPCPGVSLRLIAARASSN